LTSFTSFTSSSSSPHHLLHVFLIIIIIIIVSPKTQRIRERERERQSARDSRERRTTKRATTARILPRVFAFPSLEKQLLLESAIIKVKDFIRDTQKRLKYVRKKKLARQMRTRIIIIIKLSFVVEKGARGYKRARE
jgi:hypothetical protein